MEPVNIVTLVGLIGTAIGYGFTRLDQRSIRVRLKNDIKLLEMSPVGSAAHASLAGLVDKEAEQLNRRTAGIRMRLLPRGVQVMVTATIIYLAVYVAHYTAFHYFGSSMTMYVTWDGGGGSEPTSAANWIDGTTSSLQTLAVAVALVGAAAVGCSFALRILHSAVDT